MKNEYLDCGKIVTTHGVKGGIKVESFCDSVRVLASISPVYLYRNGQYEEHRVLSHFIQKNLVVMTLSGFDDLDAVLPLRGQLLYCKRDQIPLKTGAMLQVDMIGLPVINKDTGIIYGKLLRIDPSPASDLLVIQTKNGEVLLPNIAVFVSSISENGIFVTPPNGLFEEEHV